MLRCGVVSPLREGVAPKDAPYAEKDTGDNAQIVDAALGIFRAGGRKKAGMAGEVFLIEPDEEHAEGLYIGLKYPASEIAGISPYELHRPDLQAVSPC